MGPPSRGMKHTGSNDWWRPGGVQGGPPSCQANARPRQPIAILASIEIDRCRDFSLVMAWRGGAPGGLRGSGAAQPIRRLGLPRRRRCGVACGPRPAVRARQLFSTAHHAVRRGRAPPSPAWFGPSVLACLAPQQGMRWGSAAAEGRSGRVSSQPVVGLANGGGRGGAREVAVAPPWEHCPVGVWLAPAAVPRE